MKIIQHIPDFMSGYERHEADVGSTIDVLDLEFVKRWSGGDHFDHFEQTSHGNRWLLMAIMDDGKHWVVAYSDDDLGLPEWKVPA
jgi:hypothetical protein